MPIKNKDGSNYRLKAPNPLLKSQDLKEEPHIVHNFDHADEIIVKYRRKREALKPVGAVVGTPEAHPVLPEQLQLPPPSLEPPLVYQPVVQAVPPTRPVPMTDDEPDQEPTPPDDMPEEPYSEFDTGDLDADRVACWCLPGEFRGHFDNLYGETRKNVTWGEKFMFEGIIVDMTEMNFQLWTQVHIKPPSIIFVRPHKRWWRVNAAQVQDNGFLMTCLPSDSRPRFD